MGIIGSVNFIFIFNPFLFINFKYKVKNTWGVNFGEKGYVRWARNKGNVCKVCSYGFFPNLKMQT